MNRFEAPKGLSLANSTLSGKILNRRMVISILATSVGFSCYRLLRQSDYPNPLETYEMLKSCSSLRVIDEPYLAKESNAPNVVLVQDTHGSWQLERNILNELHEKLGIKYVGLEGWAGHETDHKRGYQLLNGEVDLIKRLLADENFTCIGLEQSEEQIIAHKISAATYFYPLHRATQEVVGFDTSAPEPVLLRTNADTYLESIHMQTDDETHVQNLLEVERFLNEPFDTMVSENWEALSVDTPLREFMVDRRSKFAAQHMNDFLVKHHIGRSAMVFGRDHTESIVDTRFDFPQHFIVVRANP